MQSTKFGILAFVFLAVPTWATAQDPAVKDLLDRVSKALGGNEKNLKLHDVTLKAKAQIQEGGNTVELTAELSIKEIDRLRGELTMNMGGMVKKATIVIVPGKGWARDADRDKVEEAPADALAMIQTVFLTLRAPTLPAVLAARKDLTLAHGGEAKVDDAAAEILRISRKDRPDVAVYYDKKSNLPVKCEATLKDDSGQEKAFAFQFSDFKEFGGCKHFSKVKITIDNKDTIDVEVTDMQPSAKFEANTFDKP